MKKLFHMEPMIRHENRDPLAPSLASTLSNFNPGVLAQSAETELFHNTATAYAGLRCLLAVGAADLDAK